ncbi:MAG: translation initiation factor IF-2 subunit beta [Candidatus Jordarchaeum sp.]|uniref:translation initiation factor IF-2 subunit beta n=1 Tax=Candidatus Jordarchaeum sp. TaxID=2823881 RepID=UPI004049E03A
MENYERLLDRARQQVPPEVFESKRFDIPKSVIFVEGNRTIIRNYRDIALALNRDPPHLMKFLMRELATAGVIEAQRAVFQGRFTSKTLDDLILRYTKIYVLCPECGKPDTHIEREHRFQFLVCEACGAKASIKSIQ